jgi:hypothetical protein
MHILSAIVCKAMEKIRLKIWRFSVSAAKYGSLWARKRSTNIFIGQKNWTAKLNDQFMNDATQFSFVKER